MKKIIIWQNEVGGKYHCEEIFPESPIYYWGLEYCWHRESEHNYSVNTFAYAESLQENSEHFRGLVVDYENYDFSFESIYVSENSWFVGDKYLTHYVFEGKATALVDVDDDVNIEELSQDELLQLILKEIERTKY